MTRRDQTKKGKEGDSFFLSATPPRRKKNLKGLPFSKQHAYVSRVTEFIALRLALAHAPEIALYRTPPSGS